jgi:hypothetical protein
MDDPKRDQPDPDEDAPLSRAGWIAIIIMALVLVAAGWYALHVWNSLSGVQMSGAGWTFLVMGVLVTTAVGGGLMALVFYSSRHNMDR